jgi:hypothetical protein
MKLLKVFAILLIVLTASAACGGGNGGTVNPTPTPTDNTGQSTLAITGFTATPSTGGSPLGVNFIATVNGGRLPYTYSWDFNNDGAFDFYTNEVGSKVEQAYHLYYLRDADRQAGVSTYQAVVKVVDGDGTARTSTPVSILVTGEAQFALDTTLTRIISDQVSGYDDEGNPIYLFLSGQPLYARVFPSTTNPGLPPYRFQWDFNGDGRIESTLQNPQYTFTLLEGESATYVIKLTVTDSNDYSIQREFPITVLKQIPAQPSGPPELLVNTSPPTLADNTILISFDSSSDDPSKREPRLNASVTVDPDHPGVPPYSYFWDFTNDGIYDANTTSVSVPYYDSGLKILINPYNTFGQASRTFTMALRFLDGVGQIVQKEWTVRVVDRAYEPVVNPLLTQALVDLYGVNNSSPPDGNYETMPDGTYAEQARKVSTGGNAEVKYRTGSYRFMIDLLGDGVYAWDVPEGPAPGVTDGVLEWDPNYDGVFVDVDLDGDANTQDTSITITPSGDKQIAEITVNYPPAVLPGYKAVATKVVALDSAGLEVASRTDQIPLSFVLPTSMTFDATGDAFKLRRDFGIAGVTVIDDRGSPDPVDDRFAERRVYCIGGMNGNVALRSVQLIKQEFDINVDGWSPVISISDRLPLSTARGQLIADPLSDLATTTTPTEIYAIGGFNNEEQTLSVVEMLPSIDGDAQDDPIIPWTTVGSIGNNNTQLRQMASVHGISLGGDPAIIMMGGLQDDPLSEQVSSTGWIYVPASSTWDSSIIASMPTPRYDFAMVLDAPSGSAIYLYVIGGRNNQGQSTRAIERVNLLTGGWEILPDMKYARAGNTAQIIRGIIYTYGGMNYPDNNSAPSYVAEAEVFNPLTYVWSTTISPGDTLGRVGAGSVALPTFKNADGSIKLADTIWVIGGENTNGLTDTAYQMYLEGVANLP